MRPSVGDDVELVDDREAFIFQAIAPAKGLTQAICICITAYVENGGRSRPRPGWRGTRTFGRSVRKTERSLRSEVERIRFGD